MILSFPQSFIRSDTRNNLLKKLTNKRNHWGKSIRSKYVEVSENMILYFLHSRFSLQNNKKGKPHEPNPKYQKVSRRL